MSESVVFSLDGVPVYQNKAFRSRTEALACPRGQVVLSLNSSHGIVHNVAFDQELLTYDGSYQNEQCVSPSFRHHLEDVLAVCSRHFGTADLIAEVGCGKGSFVRVLSDAGYRVIGVDPAYEGDEPHIIKQGFSKQLGLCCDGMVLRHVLEHIPEPLEFLSELAHANRGRGLIYIEVPCLDWILRHRAWFDILYEHVNYFRLDDFRSMFGTIHEIGRLFEQQYLYVVADLASLRSPRPGRGHLDRLRREFDGLLTDIDRWQAMARSQLPQLVWGAGAKGAMFCFHLAARGSCPDMAIDINPAKQGSYLPVSGVPILGPESALSTLEDADIFVMNSNYLQEIRRTGGERYRYLTLTASPAFDA